MATVDIGVLAANWQKFLDYVKSIDPQFFVDLGVNIDKFIKNMTNGTGIVMPVDAGIENLDYSTDDGSGTSLIVPLNLTQEQIKQLKVSASEGIVSEEFGKFVRGFILGLSVAGTLGV